MPKRTILYVYPFCNLGGVASVLKQRLPYLVQAGYEVHGLFGRDYGGARDLRSSGMKEVRISAEYLTQIEQQAGKYDIVCVVDMPQIVEKLAADLVGTTLIYEIHSGIESVILKNSNEALTGCKRVVVPSRWLKDTLLRFYPIVEEDQISVCPNLVDADLFASDGEKPSDRNGHVVWVGKIDDHKNWQEALEIFRLYFLAKPDARAYVATGGRLTGNAQSEVLRCLEDMDLVGRLLWLHNIPYSDMPQLYQKVANTSGALLQCSRSESFGMVVHEAGRCGVPAVSRRSGAVAEFIESGVSGLIYEDGDVETAAKGLFELTQSPDTRDRIMLGVQQRLADYQPADLAASYIRTIESM